MHSKTAILCKIMHSEDRKNCKVSDFVQFRTCEIPILCSLERFFLHISKINSTFVVEKFILHPYETPHPHLPRLSWSGSTR